MGRVKAGWLGMAMAGALVFALGCVNADYEGPAPDQPSEQLFMAAETLDLQFEQISWESGPGGGGWLNELPNPAATLCDCTDLSCRQEWVDDNLGCDLCVVVSCSGTGPQHTCVPC